MKVVVYTVPGTGTRFLCDLLETVFGYRKEAFRDFKTSQDTHVYVQFHVQANFGRKPYQEDYKLDEIPHSVLTLTSLRNPKDAAITRGRHGDTLEWTIARWWLLMKACNLRPVMSIPVDSDLDRTKLLTLISQRLDVSLPPADKLEAFVSDWSLVGSGGEGKKPLKFSENDLKQLDFAVAWYDGVIEQTRNLL